MEFWCYTGQCHTYTVTSKNLRTMCYLSLTFRKCAQGARQGTGAYTLLLILQVRNLSKPYFSLIFLDFSMNFIDFHIFDICIFAKLHTTDLDDWEG